MPLVTRHGALSDIGLHRKTNEDSFVAAPPLFAVCDGMGGAQAGEVASSLAVETLVAGLTAGVPLLEAAEQANAAVFARASADVAHAGMGTTLTAVVVQGALGHFVHIGDSRAYLLRGGALQQLSDDHSLVGEMIREGRLTEEEAAVHPHRSILSRALGTEPVVRIDEFEVDLLGGDVLLLCSDGLCGVVPAPLLAKHLGRSDPQDAAGRLIAEARKAGGPDNITAVVIRVETPEPGGPGEDEVTLVEPPREDEVTLVEPPRDDAVARAEPPEDDGDIRVSPPPLPPLAGTAPEREPGAEDDPSEAVTQPGRSSAADGTLFAPGGVAPAVAAAAPSAALPDEPAQAGPPSDAPAPAAPPDAPGAATGAAPPVTDPVPPAPGPGAPAKPRRRRRLGWFVLALALLVLAGGVCAFTLSTVFYIGTDDGRLSVYSGLPAEVGPLPLHAVYRRSSVEYSSLTPAQRQVVDERALRGRTDVLALAAALGMQL